MSAYPTILGDIPLANTLVFSVLALLVLLTFQKNTDKEGVIPIDDTQELKGLAIISVIFIHIGYTLVNNWEFLHPISTLAGTGLEIFLFLSGYGLTISILRNPLSPIAFYKGRLIKILIPFWVSLVLLLLIEYFAGGVSYSWQTVISSFLVWFPRADIWNDLNSPYWYMTWLLVFYILFPLVFNTRRYYLTAFALAFITSALVYIDPLHLQVTWLHRLHTLAFPLGILVAGVFTNHPHWTLKYQSLRTKYSKHWVSILIYLGLASIGYAIWNINAATLSYMTGLSSYFTHGHVAIEQLKSLLLATLIIFAFSWKTWKSRFLWLYGALSYEIYLLHWPLMARYDIFFHHLPAWLATLVWLGVLMVIGWGMQKMVTKVLK